MTQDKIRYVLQIVVVAKTDRYLHIYICVRHNPQNVSWFVKRSWHDVQDKFCGLWQTQIWIKNRNLPQMRQKKEVNIMTGLKY